jgi:dihydroxy-acid dehydratase
MTKRKYSKELVDGPNQAASRSMLRGVGFTSEDFTKPFVGIASTGAKVTPCNMHINQLAEIVEKSVDASGGKGVLFNTITVSDGISMGTQGMKYSLVSREVIADSIETVVGCLGYDGVIAIGGCDKNMPGCVIGMARLNRPSIFIYGGSIQPSEENTDYVTVCEKTGEFSKGDLEESELIHVEKVSVKGPGSCGGMYTANTMASAIEALGMSLPGSSSQDAISKDKQNDCLEAGLAVMNLLDNDIKPSDIMTKESFENAIVVVIALGGSTNAVLHLLAMAHAIGVDLNLDDFTRIGKKTPVMADLKPFGSHYMSELNANGGIQPLMKTLLDKGLLNGECITVTGKTFAENLENIDPYKEDQNIIKAFDNPIKQNSHLRILYGNLAKEGAVAKITGKEGTSFEGSARVFDSEEDGVDAILSKSIKAGDIVVIRYEGPKGGPGMREMLKPTSAIMGQGLGDKVGFITDGRFSGGTHGFVVGHITPEAADGGLIAIVEDGDTILIDANDDQLILKVSEREIAERMAKWVNPKSPPKKGVLAKFARSVKSASLGAITD